MRESHKIDTKWREATITTLEEKVQSMNDWLEHTDDLLAIFEGQEDVETALRSMAGIIRTQRDDIQNLAEIMLARLNDQRTQVKET